MFKKLCWEILFRYKNARQKRLIRVYKKKYPDCIDDEYNCGNLKFIWALNLMMTCLHLTQTCGQ